ncbi:MAG: NUDIX hydrolase [Cyclobacteriaceae bacterium]|nr:NUDIX hydrolase [Cyclobacteriaceae bacterium]
MNEKYKWLTIARHLQSIGQAGLTYTENKYDLERYEQIMQLSKEIIADFSTMAMEKLDSVFALEEGYLTSKVDVRAVVFREEKILLVQETIDGKWALPGGWADVGLSPAEVVVKEVAEESGLEVQADKLLAVFDKKCHPHPPELYYVYKMFFLCHEIGGTLKTSIETSDAGFFAKDQLPELSTNRNTTSQIITMFGLRNTSGPTLFD